MERPRFRATAQDVEALELQLKLGRRVTDIRCDQDLSSSRAKPTRSLHSTFTDDWRTTVHSTPSQPETSDEKDALQHLLCDKCFKTAQEEGEWFRETLLQNTKEGLQQRLQRKLYDTTAVQATARMSDVSTE